MSRRAAPPFRADHVGSLLRPERLRQARADRKAGKIDDTELRAVEDDAIREVVAQQREVGLQSATDGEFRRTSWHMDFIYSLAGVSQVSGESLHVQFHNEEGTYDYAPPAMRVDGRVGLPGDGPIFGDAFAFLRDTVEDGVTAKLTVPSPSMVHYRGGNSSIDKAVYPDIEQFWADLTDAYSEQARRVHALGCRYLQFDDTSLAYINDPAQREHIEAIGGDPDHLHEQYIANINRALSGRPDELAITTHLCRGNNQSMWAAEGSYEHVAEALFGDLEVDGYFLEYDDERSGGFEPLRFVPKGKQVVLGLVTTKRPQLESKDELKRRIEEASKYVDFDQLCISGQCGFSSTEEGNKLTIDDQLAKLRLIVETAEEVWGR
jgi:5-methyltetrahydropteroyltriglutamate--homocysteine methyltransferase